MPSQHTNSYYAATAIGQIDFPVLDTNQDCDVCVIGGGFTGLSSALHLAERGYKVILIEGERVGWGASGRNGGLVCTGQRHSPDTLEEMMGYDAAKLLWDIAEEAKATQQGLIKKHNIACDYRPGMFMGAHKPRTFPDLVAHAESLTHKWGYKDIEVLEKPALRELLRSDAYHGGVYDKGAGHLHPLNYALGLARAAKDAGVQIFENTRALALDKKISGNLVKCEKGDVTAKYIVLACNGYLGRFDKRLAPQIMPINNFMLATEVLGEDACKDLIANGAAADDTKFVVNYYRCSADNRLLFGGGEKYSSKFPKDIKRFVRKYMLEVFPQLKDVALEYGWGGAVAVTMNRLPSIGSMDGNVIYAHGFSGQGLLLTTQVGKLIAEVIAGQAERFDAMANIPTPNFPGGTLLRYPGLVAGMLYYTLKDRL